MWAVSALAWMVSYCSGVTRSVIRFSFFCFIRTSRFLVSPNESPAERVSFGKETQCSEFAFGFLPEANDMELASTQWVRASARNTPVFRRRQDRQSRTGALLALPNGRNPFPGGATVFLWQSSAEKKECKGAKPLGRYILTALLRQPPIPLAAPFL